VRRLAQPVALRDLLADRDGRRSPRRVAVTLDDGYRDVATRARPLLEDAGVPATAFVLTGDAGTQPWWDDLARLLRPGVPSPTRCASRSGGVSARGRRPPPTDGGSWRTCTARWSRSRPRRAPPRSARSRTRSTRPRAGAARAR